MPPDLGQFQVLVRGCKPLPQDGYQVTIEIRRHAVVEEPTEQAPAHEEGCVGKAVPA
jgi:hypothetical protein